MEILVIGATGRTGRRIVRMALNEGHRVTVFVRSPEKLDRPQTGVNVVQGDALDATAIQNLISTDKFDSIIIAIGADSLKCSNVRGDSTKNVITALEGRNLQARLWVVSSAGTNESMEQLGFFSKTFVKTILKGHIKDHTNQENYLKGSTLPYTIVRPTGLKDDDSNGDYLVMEKGRIPTDRVSRQDVAHFIIKNINNKDYLHKAVILTSAKKD